MHLSIGQEASAVGACWPLGPTDVITSTHRGHGHCLAKGLDPLGMFAELMAQGRRARTAGAAARCTSPIPTIGIFGANGIVGRRACRSRWARRPRRSCAATARVAVAFFGDGAVGARRVPRSGQPRRGVAAAGDLLLREQRLRRVLARRRRSTRRRSSSAPRATASTTSRSTATTSSRPRPRCTTWSTASAPGAARSIVEAATYRWHGHYEGDPQRYRSPDEVRGVGGARPAARARAPAPRRPASPTTTIDALRGVGRARARRRRRRRARGSPRPAPATLHRLRRPRRDPTRAEPPAAGRRRAGVPHDGRDPRRARSRARGRRAGVRRRHRRRRRRQRVRPHARPARPVRRSRPRHADLRDARSWASASARRWRACARSSS